MPVTLDDLSNMDAFGGGGERREAVTFLPEPAPREAKLTIISTDDHVVEPPHMWEGRFPTKLAELAPRVVDTDAGASLARHIGDADGVILVNHGAIVIGASVEEATYRAVTFDRMCRLTADGLTAGIPTHEIAPEHRSALKDAFRTHALDAYWNGAVRPLVRDQPDVLD